jgi:hypothetical protein
METFLHNIDTPTEVVYSQLGGALFYTVGGRGLTRVKGEALKLSSSFWLTFMSGGSSP